MKTYSTLDTRRHSRHAPIALCMILLASLGLPGLAASETIEIPAQTDWTDHGWILNAGSNGSWDKYLNGMLTASVVKKNGIYYLYYGGACCYSTSLASVTDRAIGVATSTDGINFTKYSGNPIITYQPKNGDEEGAASSAATVDPNGQVVVYYGANTEESSTTVTADSRLAVSSNGKGFTDKGIVLDHTHNSVWGSGDELFPIIAFEDSGTWYQYYLPNGTPQGRKLGVAWGPARNNLTNSGAATDGRQIDAWGVGGGAVKIADGTYALFINDVRDPKTEVRTVSTSDPRALSKPVEVYQWPDVAQFTVILDTEVNTWFMYYRNAAQNRYGVKTAPLAGSSSSSPPSKVNGLQVTGVTSSTVDLAWNASPDEDGDTYRYSIYRGSQLAGTTKATNFKDTELAAGTTYSYQVSAVTQDGVEGPKSFKKTATTEVPVPDKPSKVVGLATGSVTSSSIDLSWNASGDPDSGSYRYRIYRNGKLVATKSSTSFRDAGLESGTTYRYRVSAINQDGIEGPKSIEETGTTTSQSSEPPSRVLGLAIASSTNVTIGLTWKQPSDPDSNTYRYRVYRGGVLVKTTTGLSFTDSGLETGTTYSYQVSAINRDGIEGQKSLKRWGSTDGSSSEPPSKVIGFVIVEVSGSSVLLSWKPSDDRSADSYHYRIYRGDELVGTSSDSSFRDSGLAADTVYRYQTSAVTADGVEGPRSMKRWTRTLDSPDGGEMFSDGLESGSLSSWSSVRR